MRKCYSITKYRDLASILDEQTWDRGKMFITIGKMQQVQWPTAQHLLSSFSSPCFTVYNYWHCTFRGRHGCPRLRQGVTKKCRLSLLTNSALVYESQCGGWGEPMSTAVPITWHEAQTNYGDLPPYLTYGQRGLDKSLTVKWMHKFERGDFVWWTEISNKFLISTDRSYFLFFLLI
jgi:hypothetical protein